MIYEKGGVYRPVKGMLPDDEYDEFTRMARQEHRSVTQNVALACREYVQKRLAEMRNENAA